MFGQWGDSFLIIARMNAFERGEYQRKQKVSFRGFYNLGVAKTTILPWWIALKPCTLTNNMDTQFAFMLAHSQILYWQLLFHWGRKDHLRQLENRIMLRVEIRYPDTQLQKTKQLQVPVLAFAPGGGFGPSHLGISRGQWKTKICIPLVHHMISFKSHVLSLLCLSFWRNYYFIENCFHQFWLRFRIPSIMLPRSLSWARVELPGFFMGQAIGCICILAS